MKHSLLSQVASIDIQFGKVWKGDMRNVQPTKKSRDSDNFESLLLAAHQQTVWQSPTGEPEWGGTRSAVLQARLLGSGLGSAVTFKYIIELSV